MKPGAVFSVFALVTLAACGRDRMGPSVSTSAPRAVASNAGDEAVRLLAQEDFAGAEAQYRLALQQTPEDLAAHYGLGTVLSHLDRPDEAREQFEWVLKYARGNREEFALAQRWLAQLAESSRAQDGDGVQATTTDAGATTTAVGSMKGTTQWPGITPDSRPTSLELRLVPEGAPTTDKPLTLKVPLGGPYRFSKIPAGTYALVGHAAGRDLWKQTVVITPDAEAIVDLTPGTSLVSPDQLAGGTSS